MPISKHFEIVGLPLSTYSVADILHSSHLTYLYINTKIFNYFIYSESKDNREDNKQEASPRCSYPSLAIEYKVMYYILTLGVPIILLLMTDGNRTV